MFAFNLTPQADETPYSWLATQILLSGYPSIPSVLRHYGARNRQLAALVPGYLPEISVAWGMSFDDVITMHTPAPLFAHFCTKERYDAVIEEIKAKKSNIVYSQLILPLRQVELPTSLTYCLDCIQCDIATTGRAWWHIQHQLPGVNACLKHRKALHQVRIKRTELFIPSYVNIAGLHPTPASVADLRLAQLAIDAWRSPPSTQSDMDISLKYRARLMERDFLDDEQSIRKRVLMHSLREFWAGSNTTAVLQLLQYNSNFISEFLRYPEGVISPLHHLLMIGLLWGRWTQFTHYVNSSPEPRDKTSL